jgi:hypothetical protein
MALREFSWFLLFDVVVYEFMSLTELLTGFQGTCPSYCQLMNYGCLCGVGRLLTSFNQLHSTFFFPALVTILFEKLTCTRLFYEWVD